MSNWVAVTQTAKCKKCGRENLAWQQGKSGKWYLCVTRRTKDGTLEADRRGFHKCESAVPNIHGVLITDDDIPF
jgi:ssDNA-binding Zn-finger/Zn-ribbon topoisomerase 1